MLTSSHARLGVGLIIAASVAGAVFSVVTGPQHARERRSTAQSACVAAGGEWAFTGREEYCRMPSGPKK